MKKLFTGFLINLLLLSHAYPAAVTGFAHSFLLNKPIANGTITVLETGQQYKTDASGRFAITYPAGKTMTLEFKKFGLQTVQSETVTIPEEGLQGPYQEVTFQIPAITTFYLYKLLARVRLDPEQCHVVTTVTKPKMTLNDVPQGLPGVVVSLSPGVTEKPFYFDMFEHWPIKGKTNPMTQGLTKTTEDGGVGFANVPVREAPYTIIATKDGVTLSTAKFHCRKGAFINISPPRGPHPEL